MTGRDAVAAKIAVSGAALRKAMGTGAPVGVSVGVPVSVPVDVSVVSWRR